MPRIDSNKVFTQYRQRVTPYGPIRDRHYTITHSDTDATYTIFIGERFANDRITSLRDEVLLKWVQTEKGKRLIGRVIVDGEGVEGEAEIRYRILVKELPNALAALTVADRFLFTTNRQLNNAPVEISFQSEQARYRKIFCYGKIGDYA